MSLGNCEERYPGLEKIHKLSHKNNIYLSNKFINQICFFKIELLIECEINNKTYIIILLKF